MTAQPPPPGETHDETKAPHLAWLNNQPALRPPRIRETYRKHGRGYWQCIYGDDPAFTYVPSPAPIPASSTWPRPTIRATSLSWSSGTLPRIGIYTAHMVSDSEIAFPD